MSFPSSAILAVFSLVFLASCAGALPHSEVSPEGSAKVTASDALDSAVYRFAPGDQVKIDVYGEPDLSVKLLIEPSGKFNYPFLGEVMAAGRTAQQLANAIGVGLRSGYLVNPDVRVSVAQYRPIYISGQIRRPGSYPYTLGLKVQEAVTLAGGLTEFASTGKIYVQHENTPQAQRVHVSLDSQLLPGDTLTIGERTF
jgi:polysaccharide export outer membrane protein